MPSGASIPGGTVGTGTPSAGMPAATSVPVATQPISTADNSAWVADVSVPDGTKFYLNESFTKIWKVKNTGSTTWDNTYSLVNIDGNTWGAKDIIPLTATVQPGQEVQLKISFHAPKVLGEQFSRWKLMNSASQIFGQELYVYIDVDTSAKKTATPAG
jgi:next-to-BRCA1 protein 1